MIDKIIDIYNLDKLEILKNCILVRDLVGMRKELLYKYKKFDEKGNILEQRKVSCPILDIDKAVSFMEQINYIKIFEINDKCIDYSNGKTELTIQLVNDKYIFIEMEDKQRFGNKEYSTIEEMIEEFDSYNLPYKKGNYFANVYSDKLLYVPKGNLYMTTSYKVNGKKYVITIKANVTGDMEVIAKVKK